MLNPAVFQVIIASAGLCFLLLFLDSIDTESPDPLKARLMGALLFYTVSMFSLLIPATTRNSYRFLGLYVPPVQVWLEALTMGFLISAAWKVFYSGQPED